jgi:predicted kinase
VLLILAGLPGVGKTAVARELARQMGAFHLRIDSIEQALAVRPIDDAGYRIAYAIAEDNLRVGRTVIADSVNPLDITRDAWLDVAKRAAVPAFEIELVCSDAAEHRRRVESRPADIPGHALPTWADVLARVYGPWRRDRLLIDTARLTVEENARRIAYFLARASTSPVADDTSD